MGLHRQVLAGFISTALPTASQNHRMLAALSVACILKRLEIWYDLVVNPPPKRKKVSTVWNCLTLCQVFFRGNCCQCSSQPQRNSAGSCSGQSGRGRRPSKQGLNSSKRVKMDEKTSCYVQNFEGLWMMIINKGSLGI